MAIRKNVKRIDPRYFMDEKMERLDEADQAGIDDWFAQRDAERSPASDAPDAQSGRQDPRLVDRMKALYGTVIDKRPEFELANSVSGTEKESVTLFIDAYNAAGQQGMSNVHEIIAKMGELSRGRSNY
jgi:hypothetical protein